MIDNCIGSFRFPSGLTRCCESDRAVPRRGPYYQYVNGDSEPGRDRLWTPMLGYSKYLGRWVRTRQTWAPVFNP